MNIPFEAAVRQKDSREAADAGLLIWRENFFIFLLFFAMPFWICAFTLRMLPGSVQYFSWLILWLLKPFFDRIILHIISVRFFEPRAGMKRISAGLGKSLRRALLGDLLWRRFSPLRAAMMPVRVLEPRKKSGKEIGERKKLLQNGGLGYCFLLTLWGIAVEAALLTGEILFVSVMADLIAEGFSPLSQNSEIFIFGAWCFNYILVETLYVCMGFSVYINSRINAEGWDIEILFRGFAEKLKKEKAGGMLIILCLVFLFFPAGAASAENDVPYEVLRNILDSPDFGGERDSLGIRLKNPFEPENIPDININQTAERFRAIFAFMLRFILISLIAALAVFLFLYVRSTVNIKNHNAQEKKAFAINGIPSKNPQVLLEKALIFFEQGNLRMAWGYCAAAAIHSWTVYRGVSFPPNAAENECVQIVSSAGLDKTHAFRTIINRWIKFAYAGQLPPKESFEEAVCFCKSLCETAAGHADG